MTNYIFKTKGNSDASQNSLTQINDLYNTNSETEMFGVFSKTNVLIGENNSGGKIFPNEHFAYYKIAIEQSLRLNFCANKERIALIAEQSAFQALIILKRKTEQKKQKILKPEKKDKTNLTFVGYISK